MALMPEYFIGRSVQVVVEKHMHGVLQRVNPLATRTTEGCPNKCKFCGVKIIEPVWRELKDWPDNPILCDNNLLAASPDHFDRVMDRLEKHGWCDFNQGLDCRLLTPYHAERIGRIRKAIVRLALDSTSLVDEWLFAANLLHKNKTAKNRIRTYVLCGFNDDPANAWQRCEFVDSWGALPCPQWFHDLNAMEFNTVTDEQKRHGWTKAKRTHLMRHFYRHTDGKGSHR